MSISYPFILFNKHVHSGYSVLDTDLYTIQTQIHLIIILKFL